MKSNFLVFLSLGLLFVSSNVFATHSRHIKIICGSADGYPNQARITYENKIQLWKEDSVCHPWGSERSWKLFKMDASLSSQYMGTFTGYIALAAEYKGKNCKEFLTFLPNNGFAYFSDSDGYEIRPHRIEGFIDDEYKSFFLLNMTYDVGNATRCQASFIED